MDCVIFIGPQGSGKSSFYQKIFLRSHLRINLDMLRTRRREWRFVEVCLETRQPFVVDNTNPARADRARYIEPARRAGFRIHGYLFEASVAELLRRNAARPQAERVPERGVRGTLARLERPMVSEGFDALWRVRPAAGGGYAVES